MNRATKGLAPVALLFGLVSVFGVLAPRASEAGESKFDATHTGKIPFIVGYELGKKEAEFSGKPMFVFFTATW